MTPFNEPDFRHDAELDGVTHFATGIAVFNDGKLLVVRRSAHDDFLPGAWELPGGGVDEGETIVDGAIRELWEETHLEVAKVNGVFPGFDYTTPSKPLVRQVNFAVTAKGLEVQLDPNEHDQYRWIDAGDIADLKTNPTMEQCLRDAFAHSSSTSATS